MVSNCGLQRHIQKALFKYDWCFIVDCNYREPVYITIHYRYKAYLRFISLMLLEIMMVFCFGIQYSRPPKECRTSSPISSA